MGWRTRWSKNEGSEAKIAASSAMPLTKASWKARREDNEFTFWDPGRTWKQRCNLPGIPWIDTTFKFSVWVCDAFGKNVNSVLGTLSLGSSGDNEGLRHPPMTNMDMYKQNKPTGNHTHSYLGGEWVMAKWDKLKVELKKSKHEHNTGSEYHLSTSEYHPRTESTFLRQENLRLAILI